MWKEFLNRILNPKKPDVIEVPDEILQEKQDYTGAIVAGVVILALVGVLFFVLKK